MAHEPYLTLTTVTSQERHTTSVKNAFQYRLTGIPPSRHEHQDDWGDRRSLAAEMDIRSIGGPPTVAPNTAGIQDWIAMAGTDVKHWSAVMSRKTPRVSPANP